MPSANGKTWWRNGWTCPCVIQSMPMIEARLKAAGVIKNSVDIFQYGYNPGGVAASAGTHDQGGVLDVAQYSDAALKVWRECGVGMQHRTRAQGFSGDHGHGFWIGCPHMSSGLKYQQSEYLNGRDGLIQRGPITGPKVKAITWKAALDKYNSTPIFVPSPPAVKEGIFNMSSLIKLTTAKDYKLPVNQWASLKLTDAGAYTILKGPTTFSVVAYVEIAGLPKGRELQLRYSTLDTKSGSTSKWVTEEPVVEVIGTGGNTFGQIALIDNVGSPAKGWSRSLRLRALSYDKNVTISRIWLRALKD